MKRYIFVKRDTYLFVEGVIDFCVYTDTEDNNMLVRFFRLGKEGDWYKPKLGMYADVATKIAYNKRMPAKDLWDLLLPMMEKV